MQGKTVHTFANTGFQNYIFLKKKKIRKIYLPVWSQINKENTTCAFQKGNSVLSTFMSYNNDVLYAGFCR